MKERRCHQECICTFKLSISGFFSSDLEYVLGSIGMLYRNASITPTEVATGEAELAIASRIKASRESTKIYQLVSVKMNVKLPFFFSWNMVICKQCSPFLAVRRLWVRTCVQYSFCHMPNFKVYFTQFKQQKQF